MKSQLLLSKRLFHEGCGFSERGDSVSSGIAISLFQDSCEIFLWALIKEKNIQVKEGAPFTSYFDTMSKAGITLSFTPKILELNKARVGFKHYGNLPDPNEAGKFRTYVEEFLRVSFQDQFGENFDNLSLVNLVPFDDVRVRLKTAEELVASGQYVECLSEAAIARAILFSSLNRFLPKAALDLRKVDSILARIPEVRGLKSFSYLAEYLELLREATLASLIRMPLEDYAFIRKALPSVFQTADGKWHTGGSVGVTCDEAYCKRAILCLVDLSMRMEAIV